MRLHMLINFVELIHRLEFVFNARNVKAIFFITTSRERNQHDISVLALNHIIFRFIVKKLSAIFSIYDLYSAFMMQLGIMYQGREKKFFSYVNEIYKI